MTNKQLRKSSTNKSIAGVCGGIAEYFNVSPLLVRLAFVFIPGPVPLILYIILANILPNSPEYL